MASSTEALKEALHSRGGREGGGGGGEYTAVSKHREGIKIIIA